MTPAEEEFVERFGRQLEADGVPRIGGRLYGYLLLQTEPRSLGELAEALSVSKASISTNARHLVHRGLVERVTRPGDRRDFYAAADDLAGVLEFRLERVHAMTELLDSGVDVVPDHRAAAADRLSEMARFHEAAAELLEDLRERWFGPDR